MSELEISKLSGFEAQWAKKCDVNGDGKLSDAEIQQAGGMSVFEGVNEDAIIQACSYKLANLSLDYNSRNLSEFSQSVVCIQCQAWPSLTSK